ncbi:MAG: DUF2061 domain-containing protein [Rubrivivax sp.]|nr:DUF2061 domain-containing protein [Rubrivivax sp.]
MAKSTVFGVIHLGVSFAIGFAVTGSVAIAGAITLIEPVANTVAHYFFDRWWARRSARNGGSATGAGGGGPASRAWMGSTPAGAGAGPAP